MFDYIKTVCNTCITMVLPKNTVSFSLTPDIPLGKQLKYYRLEKGLRQIDLANALNIPRCIITDLENFELKLPNVDLLKQIFKYLEIEDKVILPDYIKFLMDKPSLKIKKCLEKHGLENFSKISGISKSALQDWAKGKKCMTSKSYDRIKKYL